MELDINLADCDNAMSWIKGEGILNDVYWRPSEDGCGQPGGYDTSAMQRLRGTILVQAASGFRKVLDALTGASAPRTVKT